MSVDWDSMPVVDQSPSKSIRGITRPVDHPSIQADQRARNIMPQLFLECSIVGLRIQSSEYRASSTGKKQNLNKIPFQRCNKAQEEEANLFRASAESQDPQRTECQPLATTTISPATTSDYFSTKSNSSAELRLSSITLSAIPSERWPHGHSLLEAAPGHSIP